MYGARWLGDYCRYQPPASLVHFSSTRVSTLCLYKQLDLLSQQAKPLSPSSSTPPHIESSIAILTLRDETKNRTFIPLRDNGRKPSPQSSTLEQETAFQHTERTFSTEQLKSAHHTRSHSTPATVPSPVPDGRSSISERAFVRPIHQTAGRPFLPTCPTYGSQLEFSG